MFYRYGLMSIEREEIAMETFVTFNAWVNGEIKEIIVGSKPVTFESGGPDDEGFEYVSDEYVLENGVVIRNTYTESRDCDGRMSSHVRSVCPVGRLSVREFEGDKLPDWERSDASQRDYSAEAAGY